MSNEASGGNEGEAFVLRMDDPYTPVLVQAWAAMKSVAEAGDPKAEARAMEASAFALRALTHHVKVGIKSAGMNRLATFCNVFMAEVAEDYCATRESVLDDDARHRLMLIEPGMMESLQ